MELQGNVKAEAQEKESHEKFPIIITRDNYIWVEKQLILDNKISGHDEGKWMEMLISGGRGDDVNEEQSDDIRSHREFDIDKYI